MQHYWNAVMLSLLNGKEFVIEFCMRNPLNAGLLSLKRKRKKSRTPLLEWSQNGFFFPLTR